MLVVDNYFNVNFCFSKELIDESVYHLVSDSSKSKIFVVDGNVLSNATLNSYYLEILNNSKFNICDGASIALFLSLIYRKKFFTYTGPDFFFKFVSYKCKHVFVGNSLFIHHLMQKKISSDLAYSGSYFYLDIPFIDVNLFNFSEIAFKINEIRPDFIWVSLGAPKQEIFIDKLFPFLEKGILVGVGAAFNFFVGDTNNKRAPIFFQKIKLEWLYRSILQPKRIGVRALNYFRVLPRIIYKEIYKVYLNKKS